MDSQFEAILNRLDEIYRALGVQLESLLLPSQLYQIAILLVCAGAAWVLKQQTDTRLRDWLHDREGWPKWRLRVLVVVQRRLWLVYFTALAWLATGLMAEFTIYPSRYYTLNLVATIATALLAVAFAVRLVRNPLLRRIVTWGLWIYIVLYFLGLSTPVARFLENELVLAVGDFRISALRVLQAIVITGLLLTAARLLARGTAMRLERAEDISPSMQVLAVKFLQVVLYALALFIGLQAVGFDLTGLAFLSGAIGVGLGFGLQKVVSNLVSGIIILLDKSIKPGDVISLGETFGWINSLGGRYVSVVTRDGKEYLIPNEDLITGQVVNWSHSNEFVRLDLYFGTSYRDDPHTVRRIAVEAAKTVKRVLHDRPPVCHIVGFGDSSVDYILRFWITDPADGLTNIRGNVYLALWDAFKENGITIPFPQREVRVLEGSTLATSAKAID